MSQLEADLRQAIPADARRILVAGAGLLRHRALWEQRNPLAVLETPTDGWGAAGPPAGEPAFDAAILGVEELGPDAAVAFAWTAARLAATGTLALHAVSERGHAAIQAVAAQAPACGLAIERQIGDRSTHGIVRFHRADNPPPQLLLTAHPPTVMTGPIGASVIRVRVHEPFEQLASLPGVRCRIWSGREAFPATDPGATNILLVQRKFLHEPARYMGDATALGYLPVAEWDDLPVSGKFTAEGAHANLGRCYAVQVSTPALAAEFRKFNSEVAVFGNHLPSLRPMPAKAGAPLRILFAAINREAGWREIVQAYRETVARHGDKIVTVVVGDQAFFDALQPLNSVFRPVLDYPDYRAELAQSDITLLPLADRPFDRCKTDLKFIECAEAGSVVLASRIVYGDSVKPGKTGFLYRNLDEFRRHLRTLIDEPATRQQVATAAHRYVREQRMLANHIRRPHAWYLSLGARRAELEQAIRQRIGPA